MPTYGLLHTDRDGRLIERRQIECANDREAISAARALATSSNQVAIFQDTRRVDIVTAMAPLTTAAD